MNREASQPAGSEHFELELERGSDPISGELTDGRGLRWRFAGWLQLMWILERAKAPEAKETGESG